MTKYTIYPINGETQFQTVCIHDILCKQSQVILTNHGLAKPSFLIANDVEMDVRQIVHKYVRRWLVEQEIAEQILFFNLNNPSSSIVVKVDFDLTLSRNSQWFTRIRAIHRLYDNPKVPREWCQNYSERQRCDDIP